jgi:23S rRNA pseudouridine2604 synthase
MLLTNDGRVTERLLGPRLAHEREYRVTVDKRVTSAFIKELEHGVTIEGYATKPAKASKDAGNDRVFTITLTEGKKHQIRRMCAALGYQVSSLVRTRVSSLNIGKLKPGQYHKLTRSEQKEFLASLQL